MRVFIVLCALCVAAPASGMDFLRGDCDASGSYTAILDALFTLEHAFTGGPEPSCLKACDADGNGAYEPILEAIFMLDLTFGLGPPPPPPFPDCGEDTGDLSASLTCEDSGCP